MPVSKKPAIKSATIRKCNNIKQKRGGDNSQATSELVVDTAAPEVCQRLQEILPDVQRKIQELVTNVNLNGPPKDLITLALLNKEMNEKVKAIMETLKRDVTAKLSFLEKNFGNIMITDLILPRNNPQITEECKKNKAVAISEFLQKIFDPDGDAVYSPADRDFNHYMTVEVFENGGIPDDFTSYKTYAEKYSAATAPPYISPKHQARAKIESDMDTKLLKWYVGLRDEVKEYIPELKNEEVLNGLATSTKFEIFNKLFDLLLSRWHVAWLHNRVHSVLQGEWIDLDEDDPTENGFDMFADHWKSLRDESIHNIPKKQYRDVLKKLKDAARKFRGDTTEKMTVPEFVKTLDELPISLKSFYGI